MTADAASAVRCVQRRVDWLEIAYRIDVRPDVAAALATAAGDAARDGVALVRIGLLVGAMNRQRHGTKDRYVLTSGEYSAVVDLSPLANGWTVKVEWRALTLARTDLRVLVRRGREIARSLGAVADPERDGRGPEGETECVRRVDLAADFAGWRMHERDLRAFVGRALRSKGSGAISDYRPEADDEDGEGGPVACRGFRSPAKVTGIQIRMGKPICLRVYDKRAQLEVCKPIKRESEEAIWHAAGWREPGPWADPDVAFEGECVTRVEAEIRSEILRQFVLAREGDEGGLVPMDVADERNTARNPDVLVAVLDSIWSYVTSGWIRLVVPGVNSRLSRCPVDDRWLLARAVRFAHVAAPMLRRRHRMGSDGAAALGAVNSHVAASGRTYPIAIPAWVLASEHDTEHALRSLLHATAFEWSTLLADEMVRAPASMDRHEHLMTQVRSLVAKRNGAFGRFYVSTDENVTTEAGPWIDARRAFRDGLETRIGDACESLPASFVPPFWEAPPAPFASAAE